jgi:hypothetical protein
MANFSKGIIGAFSGRIGNLVGSTWNGIPYMRTMPARKKKQVVTPAQQAQRSKFKIAMKYVHSMHELFMISFKDSKINKTGINNALAYTMLHGLTGSYPNIEIDFTKLLVSKGPLPNVDDLSAELDDDHNLCFRWRDNTGSGKALRTDNTILVAYDPESMNGIYRTGTARRSDKEAVLHVSMLQGKEFHVYVGMMAANGRLVGDSRYLGKFC